MFHKAAPGEVFTVDEKFAEVQPELATAVLSRNMNAADPDAVVGVGSMEDRINAFAGIAATIALYVVFW